MGINNPECSFKHHRLSLSLQHFPPLGQEYRWLFLLVEFLMTVLVIFPLKVLWAKTLGSPLT